eukprot:2337074-Heterocapsa_arctica.AAC.1
MSLIPLGLRRNSTEVLGPRTGSRLRQCRGHHPSEPESARHGPGSSREDYGQLSQAGRHTLH